MRRGRLWRGVTAGAVAIGVFAADAAWAEGPLEGLFRRGTGTAETDVEDGDAKMNLPEYKGLKHAVGVVDFTNDSGWRSRYKLGYNMSIMLESALFDTGRFVLVEREKLGHVLGEQDLAASGRAAKASEVAKTGQVRPAKYIATGTVTEVEYNESGDGGGIRIEGFKIGGSRAEAKITLIVKLVDTSTGQIVAKKRVTGEAGRAAIDVGYAERGFGTDFNAFAKTPLGEAAQDCINQAVKYFATEFEEIPVTGAVVMTRNGKVIINRGENYNFRKGTVLEMREEGEALIDPETGEVLEEAEGEVIGKIQITKTSEKVSYCKVLEGEAEPARGTEVAVLSVPEADDPEE